MSNSLPVALSTPITESVPLSVLENVVATECGVLLTFEAAVTVFSWHEALACGLRQPRASVLFVLA